MKITTRKMTAQEMLETGTQKYLFINHFVLIFFLLGLAYFSINATQAVRAKKSVTCRAFKTQQDAQDLFNIDPIKYANLDGDHDGIPCEALLFNHLR